jgi:hypothetical protein
MKLPNKKSKPKPYQVRQMVDAQLECAFALAVQSIMAFNQLQFSAKIRTLFLHSFEHNIFSPQESSHVRVFGFRVFIGFA